MGKRRDKTNGEDRFYPKAAIFDMDGLLVDTEQYWGRVEIEVFNSVGIHLTEEQIRATVGISIKDIIKLRANESPSIEFDADETIERLHAAMVKHIQEDCEFMPGALAAIDTCIAAGLKTAIASASHPVLVEAVISRFDLTDRISLYCSSWGEKRSKPAPDVFLTTAKKLGEEPSSCLVFEDSIAGVQAARAAKMKCIAVPDPVMFDDPRYDIADVKLHSLTEFDSTILRSLMR